MRNPLALSAQILMHLTCSRWPMGSPWSAPTPIRLNAALYFSVTAPPHDHSARRTCEVQPRPCTCCREHLRFAERQIGPDVDAGAFLPLGDDLEQQLGVVGVDLGVAQLIKQEKVRA